jgi:DNA-binding MarR family transcriptional regulator
MSIQHVGAVLDARDARLSGSRKLVLVTLANRTNERGVCWPSQQLLADECGISVRALADHLKALEENGFIRRSTQHLGKGNGSRTYYTLHLESLKVAPADIAGAEVAPATFDSCSGSTPHVTNLQEPSLGSVVLTRARCFEAAGLKEADAMNSPGLVSTVDIERLLRDPKHPCDLELDVIPAIQSCAASLRNKGSTLANWSYCRAAILRNRDQRLAGNPAPTTQPAAANGAPASRQKHGGGGVVAASLRLAAKLRESRGVDDDHGSEAEPINAGGLAEVFSNNRRVAGPG